MENSTGGWDFVNITEAIISAINLIFVAYIYFRDKCEMKQLMESQKNERKAEKLVKNKESWYAEIVIKRAVNVIEEFFMVNNELVLELNEYIRDNTKLKDTIDKFNSQYYNLKHIIIPATKIFSSSLSENIKYKLDNYCDNITETIEKSFEKKYVDYKLKSAPDTCKYEILNLLYNYDISN